MSARPLPGFAEEPVHRFTLDDVFAMQDAGILPEGARLELIDGRLLDMNSEGTPHLRVRLALTKLLNRALSDDWVVCPDGTLKLSAHDAPEPDVYVYPASVPLAELRGSDVAWIVEVSDSSVRKDLELKRKLYARYGIAEYWVVKVETRQIVVHRDPRDGDYRREEAFGADDEIGPAAIAGFRFRLSDLPPIL